MYSLKDKRVWELYEEERSKGSMLPDADEDFMALAKALERRVEEDKNNK